MVQPSRQYTARSARRGEQERAAQRELIEKSGGWFLYLKGQRRQREQAEAEGQEVTHGQGNGKLKAQRQGL